MLPRRSAALTQGPHRAPARAMLKAAGFSDGDLARPLIGVANTWIEIGPCNLHLRDLAAGVKAGIREAGGTPLEFNTVSISDGITMGTAGDPEQSARDLAIVLRYGSLPVAFSQPTVESISATQPAAGDGGALGGAGAVRTGSGA